jgi:hypothetical protein
MGAAAAKVPKRELSDWQARMAALFDPAAKPSRRGRRAFANPAAAIPQRSTEAAVPVPINAVQ